MVVVLLGGLAAIVMAELPSTTPASRPTSTSQGSGATTSTSGTTQATHAALVVACESDVATVQGAIADYEVLHSAKPPPGTAWATSRASGGPIIESWPSGDGAYTLAWNGSTLSVVPKRGTPRGATPVAQCEGL